MSESSWVRRPLEVVFALAIAFIVMGLAIAVVRWALGGGPGMFDGTMMNWGMSLLAVFFWVVFALAIAGLALWAVFTFVPSVAPRAFGAAHDWSAFAALSELKQRYARGEVTREEYLRKLEDLGGAAAPPATPHAK